MFQKLSPILHQYIKGNDTVVLGVSGGPDSVFLLHALKEFSQNTPCKIIVAHVNHGIRGKEADKDEKFVKNLVDRPSPDVCRGEAKKLMPRPSEASVGATFRLKFEVHRVKLAGKSALEERGRGIRREFFEKLLQKYGAKWILTGHTQDDNVETIIFNFLRGSGLGGLAGMKEKNGFYLKPLLGISKKEILEFLRAKKIKFCVDKTNKDTKFRRNFIRLNLLPKMEKINSSLRATLLRNSKIFRELDEFIKFQARDFLARHKNKRQLFSLKEYEKLPAALKTAVIQWAFQICKKTSRLSPDVCRGEAKQLMPRLSEASVGATLYNLSAVKTAEIQRLLARKIGNKKIICPEKGWFYLKKGIVNWLDKQQKVV